MVIFENDDGRVVTPVGHDSVVVTKSISGNQIENITVSCDVPVQITTIKGNDITAEVQVGRTRQDEIFLDLKKNNDTLFIDLNGVGAAFKLSIGLPERLYNSLEIKSSYGGAIILSTVKTRYLDVISQEGKISVLCYFVDCKLYCYKGDISVSTIAEDDIDIDFRTQEGNIDVSIYEMGSSSVDVQAMNGICINHPRENGSTRVSGTIVSLRGDVTFS